MNTARFLAFFSANIRNANTRLAYTRVAREFFYWIKARGLTLEEIQPLHVEDYLDGLLGAVRSVNQKFAAIRMLFEWLVTGKYPLDECCGCARSWARRRKQLSYQRAQGTEKLLR